VFLQAGESIDETDYTFPENHAVDFFIDHNVLKKNPWEL
jgi:hypothetical protein